MEILVSRKEMLKSLIVGGSMSGKSKVLPILNCVKITLEGLNMTISSFDGKNSITKIFQVDESDGDTCFCVDCKDLTSLLKTLRDEKVTLDVDEYNIRIRHKKGVQSFPLDNVDEYPQPKCDDMGGGFVISASVLHEMVSTAKNFIQSNELRPQMASIFLGFGEGEINFASTDGYSLFADYIPFVGEETKEATINLNAILPLLDMISYASDVTVNIGESTMSFKTEDSMLISTMSEYKYPNYKAIIPKEHKIEIELDREEILDTLSRVMLTANKDSCLIKLSTDGMTLNVSSEDIGNSKKSNESILCTKSGEDITIGVKGTYLKTCLEQVKSEKVKMLMTHYAKPVIFKDDFYENRTIMLMPMAM